MKFKLIIAFVLLSTFIDKVKADTFDLGNNTTVYACNSKENITNMFRSVASSNYFNALAVVANYSSSACPAHGPFNDDRMHAKVIESENITVDGFNRYTLIRWRYSNGKRHYYSLLIRSNYGIWSDATDTLIGARTVSGIINLFSQ